MRDIDFKNKRLVKLTFLFLMDFYEDFEEIYKIYKKKHDVDNAISYFTEDFDWYKLYRQQFIRKYRWLIHYLNDFKKGIIRDETLR